MKVQNHAIEATDQLANDEQIHEFIVKKLTDQGEKCCQSDYVEESKRYVHNICMLRLT